MTRGERVRMIEARLAGREGLADEIELQAERDALEREQRASKAPPGGSDAGVGQPVPLPDPGVPLIVLSAINRGLWDD